MKDVNCTEIVIRIPDRIQYGIEIGITKNGSEASQIVLDAVKNGTPLPKGHGRLGDLDALYQEIKKRGWFDSDDTYYGGGLEAIVLDAPTIIKADEEIENKYDN